MSAANPVSKGMQLPRDKAQDHRKTAIFRWGTGWPKCQKSLLPDWA